MCTVSMVSDHYIDKWQKGWPYPNVMPNPTMPGILTNDHVSRAELALVQAEVTALRAELEEMKALLQRAKTYDEVHNEPECEVEDKVAILKKVAEAMGVDLSDIFD